MASVAQYFDEIDPINQKLAILPKNVKKSLAISAIDKDICA
ncbi:hypothetical protein [Psittacicella hinzii]|nr:hypothetical protein [Psittacicella hinzii]